MYVCYISNFSGSQFVNCESDHSICFLRFLRAWEIHTHALGHMEDPLEALELDISEF